MGNVGTLMASLGIDLSSYRKGVAEARSTGKSLEKELNIKGKAEIDTKSAQSGLSGLKKDIESVGSSLTNLKQHASSAYSSLVQLGFATQGLSSLTSMVKSLGDTLGVGLNMEIEDVSARIQAFTKDAAVTATVLADVRKEADLTPFTFQQMAAAAGGLMSVSKQANVPLMEMIRLAEQLGAYNKFQGLEGAVFSLREAVNGDFTSIIERFDFARGTINKLKAEGVPSLEIVRRAMKEMGIDQSLVANMSTTTSGRLSTFKDAIDSVRASLGKPILEGFKNELGSVAGYLNNNQAAMKAWATNLGQSIQAGMTAVSNAFKEFGPKLLPLLLDGLRGLGVAFKLLGDAISAIAPTVGTIVQGFITLLSVLREPIIVLAALTAGVWLLIAAFTALAANPIGAAFMALGISIAYAAGEIQKFKTDSEATMDRFNEQVAKAVLGYRASVQGMVDANKSAGEIGEWFVKQERELGATLAETTRQRDAARASLADLTRRYGENSEITKKAAQAEKELTFGTEMLNQQYKGLWQVTEQVTGKTAAQVRESGKYSEALRQQVDATTKVAEAQKKAVDASVPFLDQVKKIHAEAKSIADKYEAAASAIDKFAGRLTENEIHLNKQSSALAAVEANMKAAFESNNTEAVARFTELAKKATEHTGLTGKSLEVLQGLMARVAKGGADAGVAMESLSDFIEAAKKPIEAQTDAFAKNRDMMGNVGKDMLDMGTDLETTQKDINNFTTVFLTSMGKIPPEAQATAGAILSAFTIEQQMAALGDAAMDGFIAAIRIKGVIAREASRVAAAQAVEGAAIGIDAHSPSRATYKIGSQFIQGGVNAIVDGTPKLAKTAGNAAKTAAYEFGMDMEGNLTMTQAVTVPAAIKAAAAPMEAAAESGTKAADTSANEIISTFKNVLDLLPRLVDLEITPEMMASMDRLAEVVAHAIGSMFEAGKNFNKVGLEHVGDISSAGSSLASAIGGMAEALIKLARLEPETLDAATKIENICDVLAQSIGWMFHFGQTFNKIGLEHVGDIANAGSALVDAIVKTAEMLERLSSYDPSYNDATKFIDHMLNTLVYIGKQMVTASVGMSSAHAEKAGQIGESCARVVDGLLKVASLLEMLTIADLGLDTDIGPSIDQLLNVAIFVVQQVAIASATMKSETIGKVGEAAESMGKVVEALLTMFSLLSALQDSEVNTTDLNQVYGLIESAISVMDLMVENYPVTLANAAARLSPVADAMSSVFDALRNLSDLMVALRELKKGIKASDAASVISALQIAIAAMANAMEAIDVDMVRASSKVTRVAEAIRVLFEGLSAVVSVIQAMRTTAAPGVAKAFISKLIAVALEIVAEFVAAAPKLTKAQQDLVHTTGPAIQAVTDAIRGVLDLFMAFATTLTEKSESSTETVIEASENHSASTSRAAQSAETSLTSFDLADRLQAKLPSIRQNIRSAINVAVEILDMWRQEFATFEMEGLEAAMEMADRVKNVTGAVKDVLDLLKDLGTEVDVDMNGPFRQYAESMADLQKNFDEQMLDLDFAAQDAVRGSDTKSFSDEGTLGTRLEQIQRSREKAMRDFARAKQKLESELFKKQQEAVRQQQQGDVKTRVMKGIENLKALLGMSLEALDGVVKDFTARYEGRQEAFQTFSTMIGGMFATVKLILDTAATIGDDSTGKMDRIKSMLAVLSAMREAAPELVGMVADVVDRVAQFPMTTEEAATAILGLSGAIGQLTLMFDSAVGMVTSFDALMKVSGNFSSGVDSWINDFDTGLQAMSTGLERTTSRLENEVIPALEKALAACGKALALCQSLKECQSNLAACMGEGGGSATGGVSGQAARGGVIGGSLNDGGAGFNYRPAALGGIVGSLRAMGNSMQAMAAGGRARGGMTLVGEKGPELAVLPRGTLIVPNDITERIMRLRGMNDASSRLTVRAPDAVAMVGAGGSSGNGGGHASSQTIYDTRVYHLPPTVAAVEREERARRNRARLEAMVRGR